MDLKTYLVKRALSARTDLAHHSEQAQRQYESAAKRARQYALLSELDQTSRRSPWSTGLSGALRGGVMVGLPMIAPSLFYRTPNWVLGGAAAGAAAGGYLGSKLPSMAHGALHEYAAGRESPVIESTDNEIIDAPLSRAQRSLAGRLGGQHV